MRTTIVPAQITTVEDKIAGNLTMIQIFLLLVPVFFGSSIYMLLPQPMQFSVYKIILISLIVIVSCTLAIRIKGRVLIQWIVILLRYNNRPRYFIANKNDSYLRERANEITEEIVQKTYTSSVKPNKPKQEHSIAFADMFTLEKLLHNPKAHVKFTFAKKGGIDVSITQITHKTL